MFSVKEGLYSKFNEFIRILLKQLSKITLTFRLYHRAFGMVKGKSKIRKSEIRNL